MAQALYNREYLYGILLTATMKLQHKTIIKYEHNLEGILAWHELKEEFEYDGSKELRLEQLETLVQTPYSSNETMSMFIDKFQAYMAELEAINPDEYMDGRKKRMLLTSIKTASGVAHLIQKCRDNEYMTYEQCAHYLRSNSLLIDNQNAIKPPSRLMHIENSSKNQECSKTIEQVNHLFHTMAKEHGLKTTYNMFKTRAFRDSLTIPSEIWTELEPSIREKVNEARHRAREKRSSSQTRNEI